MQQATCKLKMAKCNWNVIKLDNNRNVWGWKRIRFLLVETHEQVDKLDFFVSMVWTSETLNESRLGDDMTLLYVEYL